MSEQRESISEGWHLDKRVPIAIIGTLLLQGAMIIWWARGVDVAIDAQDKRVTSVELQLRRADDLDRVVADRLIRVEVQQSAQLETLREIKALLSPRHAPATPP